jgi:hypothetical protein
VARRGTLIDWEPLDWFFHSFLSCSCMLFRVCLFICLLACLFVGLFVS